MLPYLAAVFKVRAALHKLRLPLDVVEPGVQQHPVQMRKTQCSRPVYISQSYANVTFFIVRRVASKVKLQGVSKSLLQSAGTSFCARRLPWYEINNNALVHMFLALDTFYTRENGSCGSGHKRLPGEVRTACSVHPSLSRHCAHCIVIDATKSVFLCPLMILMVVRKF